MTTEKQRDDRKAASLTEADLATVSGGPTEELFGAYHFLLEVAGTRSKPVLDSFEPPLKNGKTS